MILSAFVCLFVECSKVKLITLFKLNSNNFVKFSDVSIYSSRLCLKFNILHAWKHCLWKGIG
jgi:hypothetical protein